jgi:hypothetical protein
MLGTKYYIKDENVIDLQKNIDNNNWNL